MTEPTTSPENPWPVRTVAQKIATWVARLGEVWVEGQVAQLTVRPGMSTVYITLRDPAAAMSLSVTCPRAVFRDVTPPVTEGARIVVRARPEFHAARGSLHLRGSEIRPVGVGELLARLERLKAVLAAEGLFAAERKRRLPFLPRRIGLVTGRASAAERDVLENARGRWPGVEFTVVNVAVQGAGAAGEVIEALRALDRDSEVDVIVVARGGGSVEDLLVFSDEALCRAVAACRTPVVSAIGHESDTPLVDFVADFRASTPTDAGKRVVPDVTEEQRSLDAAVLRLRTALTARVEREQREIEASRDRVRRCLDHRLDRAAGDLAHTVARVHSLSPAATLQRGYAVVQDAAGHVVRSPRQVAAGEQVRVRLADGQIAARVTNATAADAAGLGAAS